MCCVSANCAKTESISTGRFRVTAALLWMQAVVPPAVRGVHAAFPEIELRLRHRRLARGGEAARRRRVRPALRRPRTSARPCRRTLWRERLVDVTAGIVAARGHTLHAAKPEPRELAAWLWIDFDGLAAAGASRPSLVAVLDELRGLTGRPVRAVLRAGSGGRSRPSPAAHRKVGRRPCTVHGAFVARRNRVFPSCLGFRPFRTGRAKGSGVSERPLRREHLAGPVPRSLAVVDTQWGGLRLERQHRDWKASWRPVGATDRKERHGRS